MSFTLRSGSEGKFLDEKFVTWDEVGLVGPNQTPGNLWAWGTNTTYGQLGLQDTVSRNSPVQVGTLTNWNNVDAGFDHTVAVKTDGTLWAWGRNSNGELGQNNTVHRSSPVQIGTLTNWKQVSTGHTNVTIGSVIAVKTDGTLWAWGQNYTAYGALGLNDTTNKSSPTQIGTLTNWKQVSTDGSSSAAIKTDNSLWYWGSYGGLTTRSSPVQLGSMTNWSQVEVSSGSLLAIKTDGTLWGLGGNLSGELGLNDRTTRSSPVQVGTLNNWKSVSIRMGGVAAIKTDGTLWVWGDNGNVGKLGLGSSAANYSSPVQVGSLTNWKSVSVSYQHMLVVKTDGTLWVWGGGINNALGLGNTASVSSPVQVGSLTNWKSVYSGAFNSFANQYNY